MSQDSLSLESKNHHNQKPEFHKDDDTEPDNKDKESDKDDDKNKEDEISPEFEKAPNVSMDEPQEEDHTQVNCFKYLWTLKILFCLF